MCVHMSNQSQLFCLSNNSFDFVLTKFGTDSYRWSNILKFLYILLVQSMCSQVHTYKLMCDFCIKNSTPVSKLPIILRTTLHWWIICEAFILNDSKRTTNWYLTSSVYTDALWKQSVRYGVWFLSVIFVFDFCSFCGVFKCQGNTWLQKKDLSVWSIHYFKLL